VTPSGIDPATFHDFLSIMFLEPMLNKIYRTIIFLFFKGVKIGLLHKHRLMVFENMVPRISGSEKENLAEGTKIVSNILNTDAWRS
jgi:hypothetical protein